MAYDNIEIEIKIEVDETNYHLAKKTIADIATFKGAKHQIDDYFAPDEDGYLGKHPFPYKWLSIRQRGGKPQICFKHFFPEGAEITDYCEEYETEVEDAGKIETIFAKLSIKKLIQINKKRDVFIYQDTLEIVFDEVKDLGYFIEIEALKDMGGIDATRAYVNDFIKTLNIADYRLDYRGYPFLAYERAI